METTTKQKLVTPLFTAIWLSVFVRIALGKSLLDLFFCYSLPCGSPVEKIHPGIYLLIFTFSYLLFIGRLKQTINLCKKDIKSTLFFIVGSAFIIVVSVVLKGLSGMAYLVNTHISAAVFALVVYECSTLQKEKIKDTILLFIFINSILAIAEFIFHNHLIGYPQHATMSTFRSAAFFGHPLANALITAPSLFFIFTTQWNSRLKYIVAICYLLALLCYGARMATLIGAVSVIYFMLSQFFSDFKKRTKFLEISIFIFALPLCVLTIIILVRDFGIGARLFERQLLDQSGMARISLFSIFHYVSAQQLWVGMSPAEVSWLSLTKLGLQTIENFWVLFILILGLPAALVQGGLLVNMLYQLTLHQNSASKLGALSFFLIASTNNSLASKSVALTVIILLLVTTFTPCDNKS